MTITDPRYIAAQKVINAMASRALEKASKRAVDQAVVHGGRAFYMDKDGNFRVVDVYGPESR